MKVNLSCEAIYAAAKKAKVHWTQQFEKARENFIKTEAERKHWVVWPFYKADLGEDYAEELWNTSTWHGGEGRGWHYYEMRQLVMCNKLLEVTERLRGQALDLDDNEFECIRKFV